MCMCLSFSPCMRGRPGRQTPTGKYAQVGRPRENRWRLSDRKTFLRLSCLAVKSKCNESYHTHVERDSLQFAIPSLSRPSEILSSMLCHNNSQRTSSYMEGLREGRCIYTAANVHGCMHSHILVPPRACTQTETDTLSLCLSKRSKATS